MPVRMDGNGEHFSDDSTIFIIVPLCLSKEFRISCKYYELELQHMQWFFNFTKF